MLKKIQDSVARYYGGKFAAYGPTPKGVDWRNGRSQELRFAQLMKIFEWDRRFDLNDFGSGYGALYRYLSDRNFDLRYRGVDLSPLIVKGAKCLFGHRRDCRFVVGDSSSLRKADYTVASGVFNVRLNFSRSIWKIYVLSVLRAMAHASRKGFAFNLLSNYSDKDKMRKDLYYGDPLFFFDHCKKNFSNKVSLLHDYDLYEFTILVRN